MASLSAIGPAEGSNRETWAAWIRLLACPGIHRKAACQLLKVFQSPLGVFDAPAARLHEVLSPVQVASLQSGAKGHEDQIKKTWLWLDTPSRLSPDASTATRANRTILCLGDDEYPSLWLQMPDPPLLVYAEGDLEVLKAPTLAIVGSRHPSPQGLDHARAFAKGLSEQGLCIVSGLAHGIDGAAHDGALSGCGRTVALVGTGLDHIYPKSHACLAQRITQSGLMLSEFPIGTPPLPRHFPERNRLIAGLGIGTLVIEAALRSGSLITARLAMEYDREVLAIPGSIHAPQSRGCHALIKQGAKLVECIQDVLDELNLPNRYSATASLTDAKRQVALNPIKEHSESHTKALLTALGFDPISLEMLAERTGMTPQSLNVQLLALELEGVVARLPGALFSESVSVNASFHTICAYLRGNCDTESYKHRIGETIFWESAKWLGYDADMIDVLVYLYENYWRPDAIPDPIQLARKLSSVGFESEEIEEALSWIDGLVNVKATHLESYLGTQSQHSVRIYSQRELDHLGQRSIGFISFLEAAGLLAPPMREMVIDRATAISGEPLSLENIKIIVLMVFWSLGEEPDALILDELFVEEEDRLIH